MVAIQSKRELMECLGTRRSEIQELGVERLGVFGSFRHDNADDDSDIDFVVHFRSGEKTYDNLFALSDLLGELLDRPVELVTPESISGRLGQRILQDVEYVEEIGDLHRSHPR